MSSSIQNCTSVVVHLPTREYVTLLDGDQSSPRILPPDQGAEVPSQGSNAAPRVRVDLLIYRTLGPRVQFLLGKHRQPHEKWWATGGYMLHGETFTQTAQRHASEQLKTELDPTRLTKAPIRTYNLMWGAGRSSDDGGHDLSVTFGYKAEPNEFNKFRFGPEYERLGWFNSRSLLSAEEGRYHPALAQMVRDLSSYYPHSA